MIDAKAPITIKVIGGTPKQEIPWSLIAVVGGAAIVGSAILLKKKK